MSSSPAIEPETPDLVCQLLDNVQGMVDALACVRWKRHQDALIELSEHGIVLIVEESGCLQAKVYLQRELFTKYEYGAQGRPRFGISLGLLVDSLNTFSSPGHSNTIEIKYPGPDMELLLKSVDTLNSCVYSEIRTRIPETVAWDYNFEQAGSAPLTFTVKALYTKARSQEEEIHNIQEQIAAACLKDMQLLNEKCGLERKCADLRVAIDEKQNESVTSALNQLARRKGDLEENLKSASS